MDFGNLVTAIVVAVSVPIVQSLIEGIKHKRNRKEHKEDSKEMDHAIVIQDHEDIKEIRDSMLTLKIAQLVVLHDRLYYLLRNVMDKGNFAPGEYNNLKSMYDSYVTLGDGDKEVHKLWTQVSSFNIKGD